MTPGDLFLVKGGYSFQTSTMRGVRCVQLWKGQMILVVGITHFFLPFDLSIKGCDETWQQQNVTRIKELTILNDGVIMIIRIAEKNIDNVFELVSERSG